MIKIIAVGITLYQEKTWGRVYVQYEKENNLFFVFKNWIKFEEKTYFGTGKLDDEPTYNWFVPENRIVFNNFQEVLNGVADDLYLTPLKHKEKHGTPSLILDRLLIEIKANDFQKVENRRDWFEKSHSEELKISSISVDEINRSILFIDYGVELKLEPKQLLVYIFYLKHPEGISKNEIPKFETELRQLYEKVSRSTSKEKMDESISKLIDLRENAWEEQLSKIKHKLIVRLGERIAKNYYITGNRTEKYGIQLDRDLIKI